MKPTPIESGSGLWSHYLGDSSDRDASAVQRLIEKSRYLQLPGNLAVSTRGSVCHDYILVVSGDIRVQVTTEKGREVVLYHVRAGEGCVLTTACLLGQGPFPAEGFTETETAVLALPAGEFEQALGSCGCFRHFVFDNFAQRLAGVIGRIEQLCSPAIERRLAAILLALSRGSDSHFRITHQQLAAELGTVREVVSRHLKHFETQGWVTLGRGTIRILAQHRMHELAGA